MGACSSDMMQKMSPQFGKYMAAEKAKQTIDRKIQQFKTTLNTQLTNIKQDTLSQVNQQQNISLDKIKNTIIQIDNKSPGTLDKAASMQRKTKQSLLGEDQVNNQFADLNQSIKNKFFNQQQQMYTEIDQTGQRLKQNFDAQKPDMHVYQSLDQQKRKKLYAQGQQLYSAQIQSQQQQAQKQVQDNLNINKYINQLKNLQSSISVDSVTKATDDIIANSKEGLTSKSLFC